MQRIVEITSWKNKCGFSSQAYYLVQELLNKKLHKEQEDLLCKWFADCYDIAVTADELRILFSHPHYYPSTLHHQFIVGAALEHFVQGPDYRGPSPYNVDGTTNQDVFIIADYFKRNVVIRDDSAEIENLRPEYRSNGTLHIYYQRKNRFDHYNVIAPDEVTAQKSNRWERLTSADENPDYPGVSIRHLERDNLDVMKKVVKASVEKIKGRVHEAKPSAPRLLSESKPSVVRETKKSSSSTVISSLPKKVNHYQEVLNQLKDDAEFTDLANRAKRESKSLKKGDDGTVEFDLPDEKSPTTVTKETQINIDAKIAKTLQQKFDQEHRLFNAKIKQDEDLARNLDAKLNRR